jgi:hypothetical protein
MGRIIINRSGFVPSLNERQSHAAYLRALRPTAEPRRDIAPSEPRGTQTIDNIRFGLLRGITPDVYQKWSNRLLAAFSVMMAIAFIYGQFRLCQHQFGMFRGWLS